VLKNIPNLLNIQGGKEVTSLHLSLKVFLNRVTGS
jgi:hypothetical protein